MTERKGYPSRTAIPPHILDRLNKGREETKSMSECLAMNQSTLIRAILPSIMNPSLGNDLRHADGIVARMRLIGECLQDRPDELAMAATSPVDTARGWASFTVGALPDLVLQERLEMIRPFATDPHFAVREWAWLSVRPHIHAELELALELLVEWTKESDANIRRFASESTRPRGVWSTHIMELRENPAKGLVILDPLKADPCRYVQESVGNWLNDVAKDRPYFVRETLDRWLTESDSDATHAIVKKASKYV
jgi:3-methyladenine DNA glycosylase AlkC